MASFNSLPKAISSLVQDGLRPRPSARRLMHLWYDGQNCARTRAEMGTSSLRSGDGTLSELTGPLYGHNPLAATDDDLTRQHAGEPIGQRKLTQPRLTKRRT